ncbi:MAG TPA: MFS transporter, partial [Gaiellales bacterium]|nr:MFS transporter [Gaiellales bacterium]
IGMAMFGAIIFIPLFLQIVYSVSPTGSGLWTLPLIVGLLIAAIGSGRAISRIGRYRAFPISGTAILIVGMYLLSRLDPSTALWQASLYMFVVGIGIGLVMQVLILVVQNDARPDQIGVVTSTATFFRSFGGSFGVAIFGAIFTTRLSGQLAGLPPAVLARLGSGIHLNPAQAQRLPPHVHELFVGAFARALHGVFLWGVALAAIPFLFSWFLKEVPLRTTLGTRTGPPPPVDPAAASTTAGATR